MICKEKIGIWILLFLSFILLFNTDSWAQSKKKNIPNIILFFVDDLGWSDLGFRNPVFETPNIDRLSANSLSFEQAYIASPTCSPSRATLLTGQHPARLKMVRHIPAGKENGFDNFGRTEIEFNYLARDPAQFPSRNWLPLENTTYAEAFSDLGYYNLFVGKWHLGHEKYHPIKQGFHRQIGTSNEGHPRSYYPPYFRNKDVFTDKNNIYLTDKLTTEVVSFIDSYDDYKPFMITFSYYSVHSPHEGRKDLVEYFRNKGLEGEIANYAAMVKATDESVGKVLSAVKKKGIEKETVVIFLSDQGGYFKNTPFRGGKMKETLFEGGARIPFFIKWPGVTKPNTRNYSVVQSTDIFPTLVDMVGGNINTYNNIDGVSLLKTIKENSTIERTPVFGYRAYEDLYTSVRHKDWKLLVYRSGKKELFNITNDEKETEELSAKHPKKVKELVEALVKWEKGLKIESYSGIKN